MRRRVGIEGVAAALGWIGLACWCAGSLCFLLAGHEQLFSRTGSIGVGAIVLMFLTQRAKRQVEMAENATAMLLEQWQMTEASFAGNDEKYRDSHKKRMNAYLAMQGEHVRSTRIQAWEALGVAFASLQWGFGDLVVERVVG